MAYVLILRVLQKAVSPYRLAAPGKTQQDLFLALTPKAPARTALAQALCASLAPGNSLCYIIVTAGTQERGAARRRWPMFCPGGLLHASDRDESLPTHWPQQHQRPQPPIPPLLMAAFSSRAHAVAFHATINAVVPVLACPSAPRVPLPRSQ